MRESVEEGNFEQGTEWMLWRPGLDRARLRRRAVAESAVIAPVPFAVIGVVSTVLLMGSVPAWLGALPCVLISGLAVSWAYCNYRYFGHDPHTITWTRWTTDRGRGECFYRTHDFAELSDARQAVVKKILGALREVQGPARDWVGAEHCRMIHKIAWDALSCLHQTIRPRQLLRRAQGRRGLGPLVTTVREQLVNIDRDLATAATLLQAVASDLTHLNRELENTSSRTTLRGALDTISITSATPTALTARDLADTVRARLQAAGPLLTMQPSESGC